MSEIARFDALYVVKLTTLTTVTLAKGGRAPEIKRTYEKFFNQQNGTYANLPAT